MNDFEKWIAYFSTWDTMELLEEYRDAKESLSARQSMSMGMGMQMEQPGNGNSKLAALQEILRQRGLV